MDPQVILALVAVINAIAAGAVGIITAFGHIRRPVTNGYTEATTGPFGFSRITTRKASRTKRRSKPAIRPMERGRPANRPPGIAPLLPPR